MKYMYVMYVCVRMRVVFCRLHIYEDQDEDK